MRYLPHTDEIRKKMLQEIGVKNIDELFSDVPKDLLLKGDLELPTHKSEIEVEQEFNKLKSKNIGSTNRPDYRISPKALREFLGEEEFSIDPIAVNGFEAPSRY